MTAKSLLLPTPRKPNFSANLEIILKSLPSTKTALRVFASWVIIGLILEPSAAKTLSICVGLLSRRADCRCLFTNTISSGSASVTISVECVAIRILGLVHAEAKEVASVTLNEGKCLDRQLKILPCLLIESGGLTFDTRLESQIRTRISPSEVVFWTHHIKTCLTVGYIHIGRLDIHAGPSLAYYCAKFLKLLFVVIPNITKIPGSPVVEQCEAGRFSFVQFLIMLNGPKDWDKSNWTIESCPECSWGELRLSVCIGD